MIPANPRIDSRKSGRLSAKQNQTLSSLVMQNQTNLVCKPNVPTTQWLLRNGQKTRKRHPDFSTVFALQGHLNYTTMTENDKIQAKRGAEAEGPCYGKFLGISRILPFVSELSGLFT